MSLFIILALFGAIYIEKPLNKKTTKEVYESKINDRSRKVTRDSQLP